MTQTVSIYCTEVIPNVARFSDYIDALNRWLERSGVDTRLELESEHEGSTFIPSQQTASTPDEWPAHIIINFTIGGTHEEGNGAGLTIDGDTGALVINGMKISGFGEPHEHRFHRHCLTIAHELIHAYSPLEGYHLLTYEDTSGTPPDLSYDYRFAGKEDVGGIFARNPGLSHDPAVHTSMINIEQAGMSEFHRELWNRNITWRSGWLRHGLIDGDNTTTVTLGGKQYRLGLDRETRRATWKGPQHAAVYDITEFLLAQLKTGYREIVLVPWHVEEKPTDIVPLVTSPIDGALVPAVEPPAPTPGAPEPASREDAILMEVHELRALIHILQEQIGALERKMARAGKELVV